jgi:tRNA wybutosine-synthesizing protein 2
VRPKKKPKANPIQAAVNAWAGTDAQHTEALINTAPKRWVIYEPMVLLPSGSFGTPVWQDVLSASSDASQLWMCVLNEISHTTKEKCTHLAVNEGIPLHQPTSSSRTVESSSAGRTEKANPTDWNAFRTPSGLRLLHGDFGPLVTTPTPTESDFESAFWVSTRQNGIVQTWAPRYTMFSRGNVTEKARVLSFHSPSATASHQLRSDRVRKGWAVDLYGGIGYFVFSYAKLGMRVLSWEINPWSVEGMRRGAERNGWSVRVVRGEGLDRGMEEVVGKGLEGENQIVVFLEDNQRAEGRVRRLRGVLTGEGEEMDVVHVNCGLLPYSTDTWRSALACLGEGRGWLHLHENVGVNDIESRKSEIEGIYRGWLDEQGDEAGRTAEVEHVEKVKTFAPGVWHCVFDVYITGR